MIELPDRVAITPDGGRAYATGEEAGTFAIPVIRYGNEHCKITSIPVFCLSFENRDYSSAWPADERGMPGPFKNQGQCVSSVVGRFGKS
jgi:hypothetical protein